MKANLLLTMVTLASIFVACSEQNSAMDAAFADAQRMADSIKVPTFCTDTFSITSFGASQDSTSRANGLAINAAIDSCNATGGGVVLIPAGTWLTGPITLKSNVNLHVAEGATVRFSTDYNEYNNTVVTRWEGVDCHNLHPLIYANDATNIGLTGKGILDGQGDNEHWWFMKGKKRYGYQEGMLSQADGGRDSLLAYDLRKTPLPERKIFRLQDALRPQFVNFRNCKSVLIEDVTLKNSPFWTIHPLFVDDLIVRGVNIDNFGPNGDGCDPESCRNVLIENCTFNTGDDCIAIKSGRNNDGRRWARPSENIYVRNCQMKNGHGGVVLGSEIAGGYKNLWVENCNMDSPELDRVIRIKTSDCRGNVIENVWVRNITVGKCYECILKINLLYEPEENCDHSFPPTVQNIHLENVTSKESKFGVFIIGYDDKPMNVNNITVDDCQFDGVTNGNSIKGATNVVFSNLKINGEEVTYPETAEN